jgi:hypothetical protein
MTDDTPSRPHPRHLWPYVAGGVVVALFAGAWFLWQARVEIATRALEWGIARQGMGPIAFKIDRMDWNGSEVRDIQLEQGTIGRIAVAYSFDTLMRGRVETVDIESVDLELGRPAAAEGMKTLPDLSGLTLPADVISVRQATLSLPSEWGPAQMDLTGDIFGTQAPRADFRVNIQSEVGSGSGEVQATLAPSGNIEFAITAEGHGTLEKMSGAGQVSLSGEVKLTETAIALTLMDGSTELGPLLLDGQASLPGPARLTLESGKGSLVYDQKTASVIGSATFTPTSLSALILGDDSEPLEARIGTGAVTVRATTEGHNLEIDGGRVDLPAFQVAMDGINVRLFRAMENGQISLDATVSALRHTLDTPYVMPLGADISVSTDLETAQYSVGIRDGLEGTVAGTHQIRTGEGSAQLNLTPIDLAAGGGISTLSPIAAEWIAAAEGKVGLAGSVSWGAEGLHPDVVLSMDQVGLTGEAGRLSKISGDLHFDSLSPPTTSEPQYLTAVAAFSKFDAVPLDLVFQLAPGRLLLDRGSADILGGHLNIDGATFDAVTGKGFATFSVSNIDLSLVSQLIDLEEFEGTGRLSGRVPVRIDGDRVAIDNSELVAAEPGVIRIGSKLLRQQLGDQEDTVDLALRALSDFKYQELSLEMEKPLTGEGSVLAHLKGANQAVLEGHPFVFNIRLSADFDRITHILTDAAKAAGVALGWGFQNRGP